MGIAFEKGIISKGEVATLLAKMAVARELHQPIVITFGLNIENALKTRSERRALALDYSLLCDQLESDLVDLLNAALSCSFYYVEPSKRTGETLSVRLAFLQLDFNELDAFTSSLWEILEIQYYSEIYPDEAWTWQRYRRRIDGAPTIDDRKFMEVLYRGGVLIGFRRITGVDFSALAFSQDFVLYQSDSYYDLEMWKQILEMAGIEDWEIEEALAKADKDIV